jgi:hypothetical protein
MRRVFYAAIVTIVAGLGASSASAKVLLVGTYHGIKGGFTSIQAAVDKAKPGDWILVGPGDYKEVSPRAPKGRPDVPSGVLITTPRLYIRGMNRNTVVVDGTKPGSPKCSSKPSDQEFGPIQGHKHLGLNGLVVWKADNVWIQNLTACNYLRGSGDTGNAIWWDGGHSDSSKGGIGGHGYVGSYLNATSTFYKNDDTAALYGIFTSMWSGGLLDQTYSSNFSDSGYYIGACKQVCDQVIDHAHAQYSALGYSGSNSGGRLVVKNSEFDNNNDGFDTNSQNGDNPPPQNGACPPGVKPPVAGASTCWVFTHNYVHDNNNANVPGSGEAGSTPVGVGISLSGARNDTIIDNRIVNNDAWGVLEQIFPDNGPPCTGGTPHFTLFSPTGCLYDQWGNAILNNSFANNGSYGHASNGDIATFNLEAGHPRDCYAGNTDPSGVTTSPANLQQTNPTCDGTIAPANTNSTLTAEILCGAEGSLVGPTKPACPGGHPYPERTHVVMHPLPKGLKTMPNPCAGVPSNPWCPARKGPRGS